MKQELKTIANSLTQLVELLEKSADVVKDLANVISDLEVLIELEEQVEPEKPAEPKFKIGDYVKVTSKAESHSNGWEDEWVSEMDEYVGNVYMVKYARVDGVPEYLLGELWCFPEFVLEKVETFEYEGETYYYLTDQDWFEEGDIINAVKSDAGWVDMWGEMNIKAWLAKGYRAARKVQ
jgi:hypothetical protein